MLGFVQDDHRDRPAQPPDRIVNRLDVVASTHPGPLAQFAEQAAEQARAAECGVGNHNGKEPFLFQILSPVSCQCAFANPVGAA